MMGHLAVIAGSLVFAVLICFLTICDDQVNRLVSNPVLMIVDILLLIATGAIFLHISRYHELVSMKHPQLWILAKYGLLLVLQLVLVHHVYFYTGWDVGLMRFHLEGVMEGKALQELSADFSYSIYPNNLFLFYLLYLLQKVGATLGVENLYNFCIYVSCFMVTLSCYLGCQIVHKLTRIPLIRGAYTFISTVFILLCPWIIIPYSDTFGMFFVMFSVWALVCVEKDCIKWPLVAVASFVGFRVKPTCIFVILAVLIIYGISFLLTVRANWRKLCILLGSTILGLIISLLIPLWVQHAFSFRLMPEYEMPVSHFLMMGINEESHGAFSASDYAASRSYEDPAERKEMIARTIQERLDGFTPETFGNLMKRKALINFNDGTFAWTNEGNFLEVYFEHDNPVARVFEQLCVPSYLHEDAGAYFPHYRTVMQGIWLLILLGIPLNLLSMKEHLREKGFMMVVLCGLVAFLMIFEARGRYLYLYSPVFLILSLCGYAGILQKIMCKKEIELKEGEENEVGKI